MTPDRLVRLALWITVPLNALGVWILTPPAFGRPSALWPIATPPYFAAQLGIVIALFGGVYAWQATQRTLNRAVIVVGALGKAAFFVLNVVYAAAGQIPTAMAYQSAPDLLLACAFLYWAARVGIPQ